MIAALAVIALVILLNALYVGAEFAAVSARRTRISQMAASGNRLAKQLLPILENPQTLDRYIAACQVGITASSLVLGAYGQNVIAVRVAPLVASLGHIAEPAAHSIATTAILLLLSGLQMILGELVPKSVALQYPEELALATMIPMRWSVQIFHPFIWFLNGSGNLLLKLLRRKYQGSHVDFHSPREIEQLFASSQEGGLLDREAQRMLRNTFRLRDRVAQQVMTPHIRMLTAQADQSVTEILSIITEAGYSRIPIFQNNSDNVTGVVHVKDLLRLLVQGTKSISAAVREVIYVPENLPILEVWRRLEVNHHYMALVIGEHGETAGMITYEDIIEEIFGELEDEFDQEIEFIPSDRDGRIYLRGDILLTDVNRYLGINILHQKSNTLGDVLLDRIGHLPNTGDEVRLGTPEVTFRVEATRAMVISEISLDRPSDMDDTIKRWETA